MKQWFCGLMALGLFLGMAAQGKGQPTYAFTPLDVPGSFFYTSANGINASGQIVGVYWDGTAGHGFLLDQGNYTTLDVPGAIEASPNARVARPESAKGVRSTSCSPPTPFEDSGRPTQLPLFAQEVH
jgi:hypothetical protein